MQRIAITGGVAEGKTTILRMFETLGAATLSSDAIAATLLLPGTELCRQLIKEFGQAIVAADGTLARGALAQLAFGEPYMRRRLNQIMHPAVVRALHERLESIASSTPVMVEAPLLIEVAMQGDFDGVIVAQATPALQRQRLLNRGVSPQQARQILNAQLPTRAKVAFADWVVRTHRTLEQVEAQVRRIWQELTESRGVYSPTQRNRI
ncbi:MAG: dephospho-CoA kinase [Fimbriimonadales bacterium]|nr:MAG: dephospho-CoA kinase [Fimbriimonadales bacterium]